MNGLVVFIALMVGLTAAVVVGAVASYRRHSRTARTRSRQALNQLLAEADELAQAAERQPTDDPPATSTPAE